MKAKIERTVHEIIEAGDYDELLSATFVAFVKREGLPVDRDAEELLAYRTLTLAQRKWLNAFVAFWDVSIDID